MRRRLISLLVILCMGMSVLACPCLVFGNSSVSWNTAMTKTETYIAKTIENPGYGSEWTVTAMARDGGAVKYGTYEKYYNSILRQVKDAKGVLDSRKALPYTKVILALTAIGKDPQNVGGYNLLEGLADFDKVMLTGTNGPIFALLALDSGKYDIPAAPAGKTQTTRDLLVDTILSRELEGGGFTVGMSSYGPETDITAMAIQTLAPYRERADVQAVIDRALDVLSKKQGSDGSYSDYGTKSCESIAQVMMALIALDLDPLTDSRFVKNENTLMDALLRFYVSGGGFRHVLKTTAGYDAPINGMATEQAYAALGAYKRFMNGDNFIYDMTDGMPVSRPALVTQKTPARGLGQATVKWSKVAGAKGYQIQYGTNKNFSGAKHVNVGSVSTLSKTLKNLNKSKTCYFKVRAYKLDGAGNKIWGQFSSTKSCVPNGKVTGLTLKSPKTKLLKVSWTKVTGAKGYQVKYATNSGFKNSKTAATTYGYKTLKSLKKGKTYWVKVRAYQVNANGTKSYGAYSAVKKLKVK
ncbi:MAG: hypothetical protein IKJ77_08485 [Firmicutes bacterium]|nr:hypothetical protein [Bacillota bacterium]